MAPETDANVPPLDPEAESTAAAQGVPCDFCGEVVPSVRRVALDGEYERLRTRHQIQYSCAPCFEKKEHARTAGSD